jgi:hypothetical protein
VQQPAIKATCRFYNLIFVRDTEARPHPQPTNPHHRTPSLIKPDTYASSSLYIFAMVNWLALLLPCVYLGVLVGGLAVFSNLYRKRKACTSTLLLSQPFILLHKRFQLILLFEIAKAASLAPWFGPHTQRNIYLSLLHIEPDANTPKVPESILKAALLRRATEDIHRIISIRNAKASLTALLQRGSVGDDLWQRFQRAEKEIEEELRDVVNEVCPIVYPSPLVIVSCSVLICIQRQTPFRPTGVNPSSNPQTK